MGTVPVYATRRVVKDALDVRETARVDAQVDRALSSASRSVDGLCHRRFFPITQTLSWDWPSNTGSPAYRLWLDEHELATAPTAVTSGGQSVPLSAVLTRPDWGPPFTHVELNRATLSGFTSGPTPQRAITITGIYGYDLLESPAGALAADATSSASTVVVTSADALGPGSLLRVGGERMLCTGAAMVATGLTVVGALSAAHGVVALTLSAPGITRNEVVLVDAERMLVVDVLGSLCVVRRAYDGSVLAAHLAGAAVAALRELTVERGALGTVAAAHLAVAPVLRHVYPGPVVNLTVGLALAEMGLESGQYRTSNTRGGSQQTNAGIDVGGMVDRVYTSYGRKHRKRVV